MYGFRRSPATWTLLTVLIANDEAYQKLMGAAAHGVQRGPGKIIGIAHIERIAQVKPCHRGKPVFVAIAATDPQQVPVLCFQIQFRLKIIIG